MAVSARITAVVVAKTIHDELLLRVFPPPWGNIDAALVYTKPLPKYRITKCPFGWGEVQFCNNDSCKPVDPCAAKGPDLATGQVWGSMSYACSSDYRELWLQQWAVHWDTQEHQGHCQGRFCCGWLQGPKGEHVGLDPGLGECSFRCLCCHNVVWADTNPAKWWWSRPHHMGRNAWNTIRRQLKVDSDWKWPVLPNW